MLAFSIGAGRDGSYPGALCCFVHLYGSVAMSQRGEKKNEREGKGRTISYLASFLARVYLLVRFYSSFEEKGRPFVVARSHVCRVYKARMKVKVNRYNQGTTLSKFE
jgi:hypothetical protein